MILPANAYILFLNLIGFKSERADGINFLFKRENDQLPLAGSKPELYFQVEQR